MVQLKNAKLLKRALRDVESRVARAVQDALAKVVDKHWPHHIKPKGRRKSGRREARG